MFCRICGTKIPDDSRFCTKCGTAVIVASEVSETHNLVQQAKNTGLIQPKVPAMIVEKVSNRVHTPSVFMSFVTKQARLLSMNGRRFFSHWYSFSVRSTRAEFWPFFIILLIINQIIALFMFEARDDMFMIYFLMFLTFILFVASYNLLVRRLHDIGKGHLWAIVYTICNWIANHSILSGQNEMAGVIPALIMLYVLYLTAKPSTGNNKYGDQYPETIKEPSANEEIG